MDHKNIHIYAKPLYHARCQKCPGMQQLNHSGGNFSSCQDFVCMGKCRNCPQRPDFSPAGGFGPDFCDVRQTSTFCYILWQSPLLTNSFVTIGREFEPSCSNSQKSGRFTKLGVLAEQQNRSHSAQHATFVCFPRILKTHLLFCNNSKYLKNNIDK